MCSGGGPITRWPAIFSSDGSLVLTPAASNIRVYSTVTSLLVHVLRGHTSEVTAVAHHPLARTQVYSTSLDGTLRLWDYSNGRLLKTYDVKLPCRSMAVPKHGRLLFLSADWNQGQSGRILHFDMHRGALQPVPRDRMIKLRSATPLVVSPQGSYVVTYDVRRLVVWSSAHPEKPPLSLHHTKTLTCCAIDAAEQRIATGDVSGRINLFDGFTALPEEGRPADPAAWVPARQIPVTTHHWHAHGVRSLSFSLDSAYMLSGGEEGVLVMWQLRTGSRTYLPRLGGPLIAIAPSEADPAKYLVCQADNTFRTVNMATRTVESTVNGLRSGPKRAVVPTTAVFIPGSGELVLPTDNSMLQFYDAAHDRHVGKLQVAPRNMISLTETDQQLMGGIYGPPTEPQVAFIAFGEDGSTMATVDLRPDAGVGGSTESSLKFWERQASGAAAGPSYTLNTLADGPHRGRVTSLAYHPRQHMAVTTGEEGEFRVWVREGRKAHPEEGQEMAWMWRCQSAGSYRGEPLYASAFSQDGSVLAVAARDTITLWDPESNALLATLAVPQDNLAAPITQLAFVGSSPYLQSPAASLLFAPPGTLMHTRGSKLAPEGTNPLVMVLQNREFCIARAAGASADDTDEAFLTEGAKQLARAAEEDVWGE
ncbi:hypothetical protein WJX72_007479 [[Myrmecia] bisecta]|uniref:WD repeat-containing protein 75 second beta-propeller domain-containing protein n=1 Tax=[Myrmecia] bisecta TaxID=41462 RepID=A0AAW1PY72_9CHLO